jgi:isopenicillin N synthase-like dioxygenase
VNVSAADRYSVPFFYQGDLATKMDPLDGSPGAGETVEQHIMGMFKKTFG